MKNSIVIIFALCILSLSELSAQTARTSRETYIEQYAPIAIKHQNQYGIPASITLAQGLLESDAGNSRLAQSSNNHFGIKCKKDWTGMTVLHDDDAKDECFRAYRTVEESYLDHAQYLSTQPRYASLFKLEPTDYKGWAAGLKKAGYATSPVYAESLIKLIEDYQLYLFDEDRQPDYATLQPEAKPSSEARYYDYTGGIDIDNYTVALNSAGGYGIYSNNGSRFVIAAQGDTFATIGRALGVSAIQLRKVNDADRSTRLEEGEAVYIDRKASSTSGEQTIYTAKRGDTLRSVSQMFAIRLSSLRRLNPAQSNRALAEGDDVRLM